MQQIAQFKKNRIGCYKRTALASAYRQHQYLCMKNSCF